MILMYIITIYILLLLITPEGYYKYVPSFIPTYPDNLTELKEVIQARKSITPELIKFHKLTDPSVIFGFYEYTNSNNLPYTLKDLQDIITSYKVVIPIYALKLLHNRKRSYQYVPGLNLESTTAYTPSYPAGHAYQAYVLAKEIGQKYPKHYESLVKLAEKCDYVRVAAGLHYPSDGKYSRWLVGI